MFKKIGLARRSFIPVNGFLFFGCSFTEWLGIHAIFDAFLLGVAVGDSEHMSERAKEIVHQFINNIFAPLFLFP